MKADTNYHGDVVVFDLDDTLMRERDYCRSGFRIIEDILLKGIAAEHGAAAASEFEGIAGEMGRLLERRENYFDFLESRLRSIREEGRMKELVNAYRSHVPESLDLLPGASPLMRELARRGVRMGLVTDGRSVTQRAKIRALGIFEYIPNENIMISEESGHDKSTPDNFRHFVDAYPEARRFFYVADNERKDFLIPNLLGWITCKAPSDSDNVHEDFEDPDIMSAPHCRLSDFSEILSKFDPSGTPGRG